MFRSPPSSKEYLYISFSPPEKSYYRLTSLETPENEISDNYEQPFRTNKKRENEYGAMHQKLTFFHEKLETKMYKWITTDCYKLKKKNNKSIVVLHIKNYK